MGEAKIKTFAALRSNIRPRNWGGLYCFYFYQCRTVPLAAGEVTVQRHCELAGSRYAVGLQAQSRPCRLSVTRAV